jgi:hypothetical protein
MAMEHIWNGILEFCTTLWSNGGPYLWIIGLFTFVFVVAAFLYPIDYTCGCVTILSGYNVSEA